MMLKFGLFGKLIAITVVVVAVLVLGVSLALAQKVTVSWFVRSQPEEQPWERTLIKEFESKNPNIKINLIIVKWDDFEPKLNAMFAAGTPPDIWSHWGASGFMDYYIRGMIADLTPFIEKEKFDLSDFIPEVLNLYKVGGRIYGLPCLTCGGSFLYYHKGLFDKAGLAHPPTDWEDKTWTTDKFLDYARKLTRDYADPTKAIYGYFDGFWPGTAWPLLFGQDIFPASAYETGFAEEAFVTHPQVIKAYQFSQDLVFKNKVSPTQAGRVALEAMGNPFISGRAAMYTTGGWGWWVFKGLEKEFPWGAAALPKGHPDAKCIIFTDPWVLAKTSKNPDAAWDFLKFLVSKEQQEKYLKAVGAPQGRHSLLPVFYELYPTMTSTQMEEVFLGGLRNGIESPNHLLVRFDQIDSALRAFTDPINLGQKTAADALKDGEKLFVETLRKIKAEYAKK